MGDVDQSAGIAPRRRLIEELLAERSKVVALMPTWDTEPPASSSLWTLGVVRMAGRVNMSRDRQRRRRAALELGVVVLAWLEAIDRELPAQPRVGGQ